MEKVYDIDVSCVYKFCPTTEEINKRNKEAEIFFSLVMGIIRSSINTSEMITISSRYFPNSEIFSIVMGKIGHEFSERDDIEIDYQKPEDKNPSSVTFGMVFPKIIIKNLNLILSNKILKDEHKLAMNSISKEVKEKIISSVKEKYTTKEE